MRYLLDTNACIDVMRNHAGVISRISGVAPDDCGISTITSHELYTGVAKSASPESEKSKVELFLSTVSELPFDDAAARAAANVRATLESQGQKIGPYDILLAGQALAASLTLVTANTQEFSRISGLQIENWRV